MDCGYSRGGQGQYELKKKVGELAHAEATPAVQTNVDNQIVARV